MRSDAETTRLMLDDLRRKSEHLIAAEELLLNGGAYRKNRRVDFWTLSPVESSGFQAVAFELKSSRADFKRDSEAKQAHALKYSNRFYYVAPDGLIKDHELPPWAGLMCWNDPDVRGRYGPAFSYRKTAPYRDKREPDWLFIATLLRSAKGLSRDARP